MPSAISHARPLVGSLALLAVLSWSIAAAAEAPHPVEVVWKASAPAKTEVVQQVKATAELVPDVRPIIGVTVEPVRVEAPELIIPLPPPPAKPAPPAMPESLPPVKPTALPPATEPAPAADPARGTGSVDWKKVPPVRLFPRPGNFTVPPTGCGYYSVLDQIRGQLRDGAPKYGYPPNAIMANSFFDADFRYLDDPKNKDFDYADPLNRIHLGDNWLFSTGGELRDRFMDEKHSRLTFRDNDYDLLRARVYGDLWYKDTFRIYVEFISAGSIWQDLLPAPIDVNKADFQNLFVDLKLADIDGYPAYVRVGRQEMLLGSQRLVSPLDWANTRRTFQGISAFRQGEKFDATLFWLQPVVPDPNRLDSVDNNQNFAGLWTTYRPQKGTFLDAYYLFLDNTSRLTASGISRAPFNIHTIGTRYAGDRNHFLWDTELAVQLGRLQNRDIVAGMATVGGGYNFASAPMNPTVWLYYDYASGSRDPNSGTYTTFNQLFPFGHYYLGFADQVGRQNIHDLNAHLYFYPQNWLTVNLQYHHFWLDQAGDALYNAGGNPIRRSIGGFAGTDVGSELDAVMNIHATKHSDVLVGYSRIFGGGFLQRTPGPSSTDLFYLQYTYRW
jgi:hypothetical protein